MPIVGTGVDLVEIGRIARLLDRTADSDGDSRFAERTFSGAERDYCRRRGNPAESFAARFAAKEAVMKVLGTGWGAGVTFQDIEVQRTDGPPTLSLTGEAASRAKALGITRWHLSLSHTDTTAVAFVVAESHAG